MPPLRGLITRRRLAIALVLVVAAWGLRREAHSGGDLGPVGRVLVALTAPPQAVVTGAVGWARGLVDGYVGLVGAEEENRELRSRVSSLEARVARLRELELENVRLGALAGLRARVDPTPVGARVIARGASERFRNVRIDRGSGDGLVQGMAVVTPRGIVGQVVRVGASHADVVLLTDPLSAVSVVLQESRVRGIVEGLGRGGAALRYVARSEAPQVPLGAVVVTSGDDGTFPPGLPVGTVDVVDAGPTGLFLDARVRPAVDLDRLEEVLVLPPASRVEPAPDRDPGGAVVGPVAGVSPAPSAVGAGPLPEAGAGAEPPPSSIDAPSDEDAAGGEEPGSGAGRGRGRARGRGP